LFDPEISKEIAASELKLTSLDLSAKDLSTVKTVEHINELFKPQMKEY